MMPIVAELVAEHQRRYGHGDFERERYGVADPHAVAAMVDALVREQLGVGVAGGLFYTVSIGAVVGVELGDGRGRVVVKLQPEPTSFAHLRAATEVQRALALEGFPAPRPLAGPVALGLGHATIEEFLDGGGPADAYRPEIRSALAAGLATLIARCAPFADRRDLAVGQFARERDALFPVPHSPLFDFEATAEGAEWIDAHARRARAVLDEPAAERPVVGHDDWRVEHVRFDGDRIVAVYDWASLKAMPETSFVGSAAHAYRVDWTTPDPRVPDRDDALAFVADYEVARGRAFTSEQRRRIDAYWLYAVAYNARCEHSLHGTDVDPVPHGFRDRLADHGASVLA
jgi:hypothetical protein